MKAQVTSAAISLHEASEILRDAVCKQLGIDKSELLTLAVCSYGQPRLNIEFEGDNHVWDSKAVYHRTHGGKT